MFTFVASLRGPSLSIMNQRIAAVTPLLPEIVVTLNIDNANPGLAKRANRIVAYYAVLGLFLLIEACTELTEVPGSIPGWPPSYPSFYLLTYTDLCARDHLKVKLH